MKGWKPLWKGCKNCICHSLAWCVLLWWTMGFCGAHRGKETIASLGAWLVQRLSILWKVHWEDQLYDVWGIAETPCCQDRVVTGYVALEKSSWARRALKEGCLHSDCFPCCLSASSSCWPFLCGAATLLIPCSIKPLSNIELGAC